MKIYIKLDGLTGSVENNTISISKAGGESLEYKAKSESIHVDNQMVVLENYKTNLLHTDRAIIRNIIHGLKNKWSQSLTLQGTGYKVELNNSNLNLLVGYSKPVLVPIPEKITVQLNSPTSITISSACKQKLGDFVAYLEKIRPVNKYKGFGILNTKKKYNLKTIKKK